MASTTQALIGLDKDIKCAGRTLPRYSSVAHVALLRTALFVIGALPHVRFPLWHTFLDTLSAWITVNGSQQILPRSAPLP